MNDFRRKVLGGGQPDEPRPRGLRPSKRQNGREPLHEDYALLTHGSVMRPVRIVNLSGGGAMIEGAPPLAMWDHVELQLGDCDALEAIVRWVRGKRVGLEFAHETRIGGDPGEIDALLRAVIARSFPDVAMAAELDEHGAAMKGAPPKAPDEREVRHPLIWSGAILHEEQRTLVRLLNISAGGAMVKAPTIYPVGAEVVLDLREAGMVPSIIHWARGEKIGLRFHEPFDVSALIRAKPELAGPRWTVPSFLRRDLEGASPWAAEGERSDLAELRRSLGARKSGPEGE